MFVRTLETTEINLPNHTFTTRVSQEEVHTMADVVIVLGSMQGRNIIRAIKMIKQYFDCDLKSAKRFVDTFWDEEAV